LVSADAEYLWLKTSLMFSRARRFSLVVAWRAASTRTKQPHGVVVATTIRIRIRIDDPHLHCV
jgi:hypothetical protein